MVLCVSFGLLRRRCAMANEHQSCSPPEGFHTYISSSPDGFLLVDLSGTILEANNSYCNLTGYSRAELVGRHISMIDAIDSQHDVQQRVETICTRGSLRFETAHQHKNGIHIAVEVSANFVPSPVGAIFSIVRDITRQKRNRDIMAARLRLMEYSLDHSLNDLLRESIDVAEELTGSCIGFYHFMDSDQQNLTLQAWSSRTAAEFCKAEGSGSHYAVSDAGVWVDCVRERSPVIHNDYAALQHRKGMPEGHARVQREAVVPVFRGDRIVAIMGVGNKRTDYQQDDIEQLTMLADLAWDVAERKIIVSRLQSSEDRYRNIVESQVDYVDRYLPGGILTYVNESLARFTGMPQEELLGKSFYPFIHDEDRAATVSLIESITPEVPCVETESRIVLPDGRTVWNRWTHTGFFDDSGRTIEYQSVGKDITARKLAEDALKQSEALLKSSQSLARVGGWEWDLIGQTMTWTDETYRIHDVDPDEVAPGFTAHIERSIECYRLEDRPVIMAAFRRCAEQGEKYDLEFPFTTAAGHNRWIRTTAEPVRRGNRIVKVVGNIMDISDRKIMEQELARQVDFNRRIFNSLDANMAVVDRDGIIQSVNDSWREFARLNQGGDENRWGVGTGYFVAYDPRWGDVEHAEQAYAGIRSVQNGELSHFEQEYPCIGPGKENSWFIMKVLPLQGTAGSVLISHFDITESKQLTEEKMNLEQQILQTQKLESLGVLAGGVAHDFNNILTIITGHCSLAVMRPENALAHIPPIETAADRAAGLCRQMLTYAGKALYSMSRVNLAELIQDMIQMLNATISQNVRVSSELDFDVPDITADASQIRQIVMNLIINAAEAVGEAQGEVRVTLVRTAVRSVPPEKDHLGHDITPGWYARLEVSDNGCGMDKETRKRLFEPFYSTKFTGRGLGMSAVLGIVSAHKGALQLTTQPGNGTTFRVFLPVITGEPLDGASPDNALPVLWQGSGTILLVEDEETILQVAQSMMEMLGLTVETARNGMEALDLFRDHPQRYRVVVTDIGMPVMDGYALFRELKKLKPELPIIISSGFGDSAVTSRINKTEIAGMINKPYRFEYLQKVMKQVLE